MYFRTADALPTVSLYDDTRSQVILLSGLPAAGKDSWIKQNAPDHPVISLDALRADLDVDPAGDQSLVSTAAKEQARLHLRARRPFIWNATNATRFLRDPLINFFAGYHAHIHIIYCEAPLAQLYARNARHPTPVPLHVYQTLLARLEIPNLTEAHTVTCMQNG